MALIKCPECGKENVSSSAASCPQCGFPIKEYAEKNNIEDEEKKRQEEARASMEAKIKKYHEGHTVVSYYSVPEDKPTSRTLTPEEKRIRKHRIIHGILFIGFSALAIYGLFMNDVWTTPWVFCGLGGLVGIFLTIMFYLSFVYMEAGIFFFLSGIGLILIINGSSGLSTSSEDAEKSMLMRNGDPRVTGFIVFAIGLTIFLYCLYKTIVYVNRRKLQRNNPAGYQNLLNREAAEQQRVKDELKAELALEREMAEASQKDPSPWSVKYYTFPCQYCGHYKVRPATFDDKRVSIAFWGILSHKIGKRFKCDRCGKVW